MGFGRVISEGNRRLKYCGDEFRDSSVGGEGAVAIELLYEGSGGEVRYIQSLRWG